MHGYLILNPETFQTLDLVFTKYKFFWGTGTNLKFRLEMCEGLAESRACLFSLFFMLLTNACRRWASRRMRGSALRGGRFCQYILRDEERSLRRGGRCPLPDQPVGGFFRPFKNICISIFIYTHTQIEVDGKRFSRWEFT